MPYFEVSYACADNSDNIYPNNITGLIIPIDSERNNVLLSCNCSI